ncbi:LysR family transcriptional regulator [Alphaproteobacteria bacterium KMM 3653]|uniref:LysR family transcriptional regulator n=1 Tax=Harenicola maris TaxID=2841044 RepID=A0AAP2CPM3_9RHOB|nr:LysR family transcriptional regulator [Harenicola maris]
MELNFKQMEAFYWLTQLQSYRLVAERLSLTQPAVSARISALEQAMNLQLIDRNSTRFRLTGEGLYVAEYAEMFVNLQDAMTNRIDEDRHRHFAVGMVGMVPLTWGVLFREMVAEAVPNVILDIYTGSNLELKRMLRSGVLDMALLTDEKDLARVQDSFSVQYDVGWAASPALASRVTQPLSAADLRHQPIILYPPSSPLSQPISNILQENRARPAARHMGNSLAMILDMMKMGYGFATVALACAEDDFDAGRLVPIDTLDKVPPISIHCVHVNSARKAQVRQVYEIAKEAAQTWCRDYPRYTMFVENSDDQPASNPLET